MALLTFAVVLGFSRDDAPSARAATDGAEMGLSVTGTQDCPGGPQAGKVCVGQGLQFDVVVSADAIPPTGYTHAWAWINYGDDLGDQSFEGRLKAAGGLWPDCEPGDFVSASLDTGGNANRDAGFATCRTGVIGAFDSFCKGALFSFTLTCTPGASSHLITLEVFGGPNAGTDGAQFSKVATAGALASHNTTFNVVVPNHVDFIADSIDVNCLGATATPTHAEPHAYCHADANT